MPYEEIENIGEIRRLNRVLNEQLGRALPYSETRIIGYPAGHVEERAYFNKRVGSDILWWAGWSAKGGTLINLWGHGEPKEVKSTLTIDVQFNLPSKTFNRRLGGAFLRETGSGKIVLAHRGIVTLGHGRFPRAKLFDAMAPLVFDAETSNGTKEFLLIAELSSKTLLQEIGHFSSTLRSVLRGSADIKQGDGTVNTKSSKSNSKRSASFSKLGTYLAEFAGKRRAYKPKKIQADCHHGLVVAALEKAFRSDATILNSREIDLVAHRADDILLFEVKTSSSTQNVYTAIGQLCVHSPMAEKINKKKSIIKVMVLPEEPMDELKRILSKELDVKLVLYLRSATGRITFSGLEKL